MSAIAKATVKGAMEEEAANVARVTLSSRVTARGSSDNNVIAKLSSATGQHVRHSFILSVARLEKKDPRTLSTRIILLSRSSSNEFKCERTLHQKKCCKQLQCTAHCGRQQRAKKKQAKQNCYIVMLTRRAIKRRQYKLKYKYRPLRVRLRRGEISSHLRKSGYNLFRYIMRTSFLVKSA